MELIHKGLVLKKDTGKFIRSFEVYKDASKLYWELTQGETGIFDAEDFDILLQKHWRAMKSGGGFYVGSGRKEVVFAHNHIIGKLPEGVTIDHINMNGLDNRKSNYRLATVQQQVYNRRYMGTSGYKGVVKRLRDGAWRAEGRIDNKHVHIGYFKHQEEAAYAWDEFLFEKFKNHNPLEGMCFNGVCGEPTLNFIHFNFPERLGLCTSPK